MRTISRFSVTAPLPGSVPDGTFTDPFIYGTTYVWHDSVNNVMRKQLTTPVTETEGEILMEAEDSPPTAGVSDF
jgi:hypothetical protein